MVLPISEASAEVNTNWFQELTTQEQHATTNFLYEQSPQGTVPYTGGEAQELSESVSHTYESQAESQPFYGDVAGGTSVVEEGVGLDPDVYLAAPEIDAAGGAFVVGWKIGEGVNALFADIGLGFGSSPEPAVEEPPEWAFCYALKCGGSLRYHPYGDDLGFGDGATVQQKPGAYLYSGALYHTGSNEGFWPIVSWEEPPCGIDKNIPPEATMEEFIPTIYECMNPKTEKSVTAYRQYPYVTISKILSREQFHHYDPLIDGTPEYTTKAPTDPGTATVEEKAAEELDENEFEQDYIGEKLEPKTEYEYFPAPTATKKKVDQEERRCDRGMAAFDNLGGNESPEPFALKEPTAFTIASLPEGVESLSPVYLRWGTTKWLGEQMEEPEFFDLWGGWGYRHIRAKHGWNALDREETELALDTPQIPVEGEKDNWVYSSIDPGAGVGGVECERIVVVDFKTGTNPKTKEEDPAPRGVVTSFNVVK